MNVIVNGREHNVGLLPSVSYELVVGWAGFPIDRVLDVTYSTAFGSQHHREGSLRRGQSTALEDGMHFDVGSTSNA